MDDEEPQPVQPAIIESLEDYRALRVSWQRHLDVEDVRLALDSIAAVLDAASEPLSLLMDTRSYPNFPLMTMIQGMLNGPLRHPHLDRCVIVGGSTQARILAKTLGDMMRRRDVHWFANDQLALEYLAGLDGSSGSMSGDRAV